MDSCPSLKSRPFGEWHILNLKATVIPAQAGIQALPMVVTFLDSGLRRNDERGV